MEIKELYKKFLKAKGVDPKLRNLVAGKKIDVSKKGLWDKKKKQVIVPSNRITMKGPNGEQDFFKKPVIATGLQSGQRVMMQPGGEYYFPNDKAVHEVRMEEGGITKPSLKMQEGAVVGSTDKEVVQKPISEYKKQFDDEVKALPSWYEQNRAKIKSTVPSEYLQSPDRPFYFPEIYPTFNEEDNPSPSAQGVPNYYKALYEKGLGHRINISSKPENTEISKVENDPSTIMSHEIGHYLNQNNPEVFLHNRIKLAEAGINKTYGYQNFYTNGYFGKEDISDERKSNEFISDAYALKQDMRNKGYYDYTKGEKLTPEIWEKYKQNHGNTFNAQRFNKVFKHEADVLEIPTQIFTWMDSFKDPKHFTTETELGNALTYLPKKDSPLYLKDKEFWDKKEENLKQYPDYIKNNRRKEFYVAEAENLSPDLTRKPSPKIKSKFQDNITFPSENWFDENVNNKSKDLTEQWKETSRANPLYKSSDEKMINFLNEIVKNNSNTNRYSAQDGGSIQTDITTPIRQKNSATQDAFNAMLAQYETNKATPETDASSPEDMGFQLGGDVPVVIDSLFSNFAKGLGKKYAQNGAQISDKTPVDVSTIELQKGGTNGETSTEQNPERMNPIEIQTERKPWYERLPRQIGHKIGLDPYHLNDKDFGSQFRQRVSDATGGADWYKQSNPFMNLALEAINAPQLAATYGVTGKVQTPSEAMDIQNPYGAMAVDMVLDPAVAFGVTKGLVKGAPLVAKYAKTAGKKLGKSITKDVAFTPTINNFSKFDELTPQSMDDIYHRVVNSPGYSDDVQKAIDYWQEYKHVSPELDKSFTLELGEDLPLTRRLKTPLAFDENGYVINSGKPTAFSAGLGNDLLGQHRVHLMAPKGTKVSPISRAASSTTMQGEREVLFPTTSKFKKLHSRVNPQTGLEDYIIGLEMKKGGVVQMQNGASVVLDKSNAESQPNKEAMTAMMKSKIAYGDAFRNPTAMRMTNRDPKSYTFSSEDEMNGGAPLGSKGNIYAGSYGDMVVPGIQDVNGKLKYITDPFSDENIQRTMQQSMRFDNPEDAQYFGENYKEVAPMMASWNKKKNGGLAEINPNTLGFGGGGKTPIKKKAKYTSDNPNYTYDQKGNLYYKGNIGELYSNSPTIDKIKLNKLNPTLGEVAETMGSNAPIDATYKNPDNKLVMPPSRFLNQLTDDYIKPNVIGKKFGEIEQNTGNFIDEGYSKNRTWVSNPLESIDTTMKHLDGPNLNAYFLKPNKTIPGYTDVKNTQTEGDVNVNQALNPGKELVPREPGSEKYKQYNNWFTPYNTWNRARQMSVEMQNNPEIREWAKLHNIDLSSKPRTSEQASRETQSGEYFAPKLAEQINANRGIKAGDDIVGPPLSNNYNTRIIQNPNAFDLVGYADKDKINKFTAKYKKENNINGPYESIPHEKQAEYKQRLFKELGINADPNEVYMHLNRSPLNEYTPGMQMGGMSIPGVNGSVVANTNAPILKNKKGYKQGGNIDHSDDKDMVNGVASILRRVKDKDNRLQLANQLSSQFNREKVNYNLNDFLNKSKVKK